VPAPGAGPDRRHRCRARCLELAERGARIADEAGGVTDARTPASRRKLATLAEAWANAVKYYDGEQLAALVRAIALINAFNRGNVIVRQPAGDYQPGQFA
jgi:hypothetical protein